MRLRLCTRRDGSKSQPTLAEGGDRAPFRAAPVDEAGAHRIALREADILGDRHPLDQTEILMDEGDALLLVGSRRAMQVGLALEQDAPFVGCMNAGEALDQRRLAGAVFTKQRQHFAGVEMKAHVTQRRGAAEALGDVFKAEQALGQAFPQAFLPMPETFDGPSAMLSITS